MRNYFVAFVIFVSLFSKWAVSEDVKYLSVRNPDLALVGKTIDQNICVASEYQFLPSMHKIYIVGVRKCERSPEDVQNFYEIVWRGGVYYIEQEKLKFSDGDIGLISKYGEDEWKKAKADALRDSGVVEKKIKAIKKNGVALVEWSLMDESEYTDGVGLSFHFFNPSEKTIKYVWVSIQGYNSVDDPVGRLKTMRAIGPIEFGEFAEYRFEYVWFTDVVDNAVIKSIKVQYMDGSIKTISKPNDVIVEKEIIWAMQE